MGGPPGVGSHWASFIGGTLACGAASVTGHVRVGGVWVTRVTGKPLTVPLSPGNSRAVREKYARATWTLYVDPVSYLPVRVVGSTATFGGPGAGSDDISVTSVRWLPATPGNIAKAKVTIPPGFTKVGSPADQLPCLVQQPRPECHGRWPAVRPRQAPSARLPSAGWPR